MTSLERLVTPTTLEDPWEPGTIKVLRGEVLKGLFLTADYSDTVARAYKKLFTYLGLAGLKKLTNDEDISIALQAAWEMHRKSIKRVPPIQGRADWVFDKKEIKEFLGFVAKRLKTQPPNWWRATLLQGDVFPARHHAFIDIQGDLPAPAKEKMDKDDVILTSGRQSVKIPRASFSRDFGTKFVILCGTESSFIANPGYSGYPFEIIGVDSKTGKKQWTSSVWAARRGASTGASRFGPVEILRHEGMVIVYGRDSHGMYAEGFDAKTGKCQFRFCTCYWFHHSEAWGLK